MLLRPASIPARDVEGKGTRTVRFDIGPQTLGYGPTMTWVVEPGAFDLMVGGSSAMTRSTSLEVAPWTRCSPRRRASGLAVLVSRRPAPLKEPTLIKGVDPQNRGPKKGSLTPIAPT